LILSKRLPAALFAAALALRGDDEPVRINEQYRAVCERKGDAVFWVWVGSHNDFDKLFG
jgi:hypothetical protein